MLYVSVAPIIRHQATSYHVGEIAIIVLCPVHGYHHVGWAPFAILLNAN